LKKKETKIKHLRKTNHGASLLWKYFYFISEFIIYIEHYLQEEEEKKRKVLKRNI
jgi:hypothetical protein